MSQPMTLDEFTDAVERDGAEDESAGRETAVAGGARYRGSFGPRDGAGEQMDVDRDVCQDCGEPVSSDFRRIFGNDDGIAFACMDCAGATAVKRGAAASEEREGTVGDGISTIQGGRF